MLDLGDLVFPSLYQFENGLRLAVNGFLSECYGKNWWEEKLKTELPQIHKYAEDIEAKRNSMPWIGASARVQLLKIHLTTLGQLEEIVKKYRSDCIPQLFPTIEFFLGHMEVIKRVRNLYLHMFPCITKQDCATAKREVMTLAQCLNARL